MPRLLRPVPGVDFKKLPLTPAEGNVFSRVDGKRDEAELAKASGMHPDTVRDAIARLLELKAIEVVDEQRLAKDQKEQVVGEAIKQAFGGHLGEGKVDASLLREEVELDEDKKRLILDAYQRLEQLNYYELLGLHPLVDKKEIKAAYYAIAPNFHPDKFYRKNLGSFRARIEAIFARLTLAHDVLSSRQRRAEYDQYLETQDQNRRAQEMLSGSQRELAHVQAAIEAKAREAAQAAQAEAEAKRLADRKRALAQKLGRGRPGASSPAGPQAGAEPAVDPRAAAEALRVRYEYARAEAQRNQVESYVTSARTAAAQADYPSAANFLRVALSLVGNDPALQAEGAEYARLAAVALADGYARQGDYEIEAGRYPEAVASFERALAGKPDDAKLHDKAAIALLRTGGQERRAVEHARRAVELGPRTPSYRITLAQCLAAGGAGTSASAELDRTLEAFKDAGKEERERIKAMVDGARSAVAELLAKAAQRQADPAGGARPSSVSVPQMPAAGATPSGSAPSMPPPPAPSSPAFGPPEGFAQQPQGLAQQPQGFAQQPQGLAQQPQGLAQQPQGFAQQPQGFAQQPGLAPPAGFAQQAPAAFGAPGGPSGAPVGAPSFGPPPQAAAHAYPAPPAHSPAAGYGAPSMHPAQHAGAGYGTPTSPSMAPHPHPQAGPAAWPPATPHPGTSVPPVPYGAGNPHAPSMPPGPSGAHVHGGGYGPAGGYGPPGAQPPHPGYGAPVAQVGHMPPGGPVPAPHPGGAAPAPGYPPAPQAPSVAPGAPQHSGYPPPPAASYYPVGAAAQAADEPKRTASGAYSVIQNLTERLGGKKR